MSSFVAFRIEISIGLCTAFACVQVGATLRVSGSSNVSRFAQE